MLVNQNNNTGLFCIFCLPSPLAFQFFDLLVMPVYAISFTRSFPVDNFIVFRIAFNYSKSRFLSLRDSAVSSFLNDTLYLQLSSLLTILNINVEFSFCSFVITIILLESVKSLISY